MNIFPAFRSQTSKAHAKALRGMIIAIYCERDVAGRGPTMGALAAVRRGAGFGLMLIAMAGCARDPARREEAQAALAAQDDAQCRAHGIEPLSSQYADCMNTLAYHRQQERARIASGLHSISGVGAPQGSAQ
jgi:type IV secretory pathway TrbL component